MFEQKVSFLDKKLPEKLFINCLTKKVYNET